MRKCGSIRVREIEAELNRLDKLFLKGQYEFKNLRENIFKKGTTDYLQRKQIIYKQNFLKMLENFSNYDGYTEFKNKINKLNPSEFYNFISMQEDLVDLQYYYDVKSGKVVPKGLSSEDIFLSIIKRYNIDI